MMHMTGTAWLAMAGMMGASALLWLAALALAVLAGVWLVRRLRPDRNQPYS